MTLDLDKPLMALESEKPLMAPESEKPLMAPESEKPLMAPESDKQKSASPVDNAKSTSPERQKNSEKSDDGECRPLDHFAVRDGIEYAGAHIIVDLWGAKPLNDLELMEATLRKAAKVAGATVLHIHLHHFTEGGGISGVAVLAESHISVHTWPERDFAAFDVFMCGDANPEAAVAVFSEAFNPEKTNVSEHLRGVSPDSSSPY